MDKNIFDQLAVPVPPYKTWHATLARTNIEQPESIPAPVMEQKKLSNVEQAQQEALKAINREAVIDEEDARLREQAIAEIAAAVEDAMKEITPESPAIEQIEKETDFTGASSWQELDEQIKAAGEITSTSGKRYTADQLTEQVAAARKGIDADLVVTRAANLRETVKRLMTESAVPLNGPGQEAMQRASREAVRMAQEQAQKQQAA